MFYRHAWMILVSGFFEPLLYLLSVQVGFATLVGDIVVDGVAYDYAAVRGSGAAGASAMNGAIFDATGNVFEKLRHTKLYDTVLATPMTAADVALGEILGGRPCRDLFDRVRAHDVGHSGSWARAWIVLAIPVCTLIGFAFAAAGMAYTTFMRTWSDLEYVNAVTLPLLLFSATFYPVSSYGDWAWVVQLEPAVPRRRGRARSQPRPTGLDDARRTSPCSPPSRSSASPSPRAASPASSCADRPRLGPDPTVRCAAWRDRAGFTDDS